MTAQAGDRIRTQMSAGALVRRYLRAALDEAGVEWTEHRGWFDSLFVVTGTPAQIRAVNAWVDDANREDGE